jgi:hypothetical protein
MGDATTNKKVHNWTDTKVVISDRGDKIPFNFPKRVIAPEATQEDACNVMVQNLLPAFWNSQNVHFFAYGQTGAGKTHHVRSRP